MFAIILFLIKTIFSLYDQFNIKDNLQNKVNLYKSCPCNIIEEVCELGCCCDPDCLNLMFSNDYYKSFGECDSSSSLSKRLDSRLDYCQGHVKAVDDLYNPLVLAYKILKKGFCLAKEKPNKDITNKNTQYHKEIQKIIERENNDGQNTINFDEVISNPNEDFDISKLQNVADFEQFSLNAPISLPNGLCLFGAYPIKKLMDYEVECSYHISQKENIHNNINNYFPPPNNSYYVSDGICSESIAENSFIKKIEITFYVENGDYLCNHYYNNDEIGNYRDFSFVVKFLKNTDDYIKSGNPGYIKGKPLILKNDIIDSSYSIFPMYPTYEHGNLYYDNYFDNKITFEDLILYRYNGSLNTYFQDFAHFKFGKYGNAKVGYSDDWSKIENYNENDNDHLLIGFYKEVGAVNNTQLQITKFQFQRNEKISDNHNYYIIKFLKYQAKKKWWYAPGPGFIKLPKNIMYPFKIGTTNYAKNR